MRRALRESKSFRGEPLQLTFFAVSYKSGIVKDTCNAVEKKKISY